MSNKIIMKEAVALTGIPRNTIISAIRQSRTVKAEKKTSELGIPYWEIDKASLLKWAGERKQ